MPSLSRIPRKRLSEKAELLQKNLELSPHTICPPWKGSVIMPAGISILLSKPMGKMLPGLLYAYRNEPKEMNIVSDNLLAVVAKLNEKIDKRGDPLTTIIKGLDEMWDVALIKFIFEMTQRSVDHNARQMNARGLLTMDDKGIPADARFRIEGLFLHAAAGDMDPGVLKDELDRWNIFPGIRGQVSQPLS